MINFDKYEDALNMNDVIKLLEDNKIIVSSKSAMSQMASKGFFPKSRLFGFFRGTTGTISLWKKSDVDEYITAFKMIYPDELLKDSPIKQFYLGNRRARAVMAQLGDALSKHEMIRVYTEQSDEEIEAIMDKIFTVKRKPKQSKPDESEKFKEIIEAAKRLNDEARGNRHIAPIGTGDECDWIEPVKHEPKSDTDKITDHDLGRIRVIHEQITTTFRGIVHDFNIATSSLPNLTRIVEKIKRKVKLTPEEYKEVAQFAIITKWLASCMNCDADDIYSYSVEVLNIIYKLTPDDAKNKISDTFLE